MAMRPWPWHQGGDLVDQLQRRQYQIAADELARIAAERANHFEP
jgi:hypothetical protein